MDKITHAFGYITKSKFVRSIFLRVLAIFLIVMVAIVAIVFFSFSSEINRNILSDKQKQLAVIESTISKRMDEIAAIAYSVGQDSAFYMEPVDGGRYSGYEMAATLGRYLVGNSFIEHLAYYRLSEPDVIYTARGELDFQNFWSSYMGLDGETAEEIIQGILRSNTVDIRMQEFGPGKASYFSYLYPLPQFTAKPQAYVLMLIPFSEVEPLLESQLVNCRGTIVAFDAGGKEIYRESNLEEALSISPDSVGNAGEESYLWAGGHRYVMQKQVSKTNGWTYVSVIRLSSIVSGLANKQVLFIVLLLGLMALAISTMLLFIGKQYQPINDLAATVTKGGEERGVIDENSLLSHTFATLKGDSEQKRKFETAYREAEAANQAKSAFLSSMSHDIRTPMNAIVGMTTIAYKHADDAQYVRECLEKAQVASRYLLDIINNVLDMSRIESGRFRMMEETVELPKLTYGIVTILNPIVAAKGLHLLVMTKHIRHETVVGDSVRLTQVFMNILSNAVKFTPSGGTIRFLMEETAQPEAGKAGYTFTFSDTGIGMSPEFVKQVFDTFSRARDADASKVEGTGLGMAIAKNLVEMMGGTIRCESALGVGTTFTVELPLKLGEPEEARALPAGSPGARRVLLVGEEALCANQKRIFADLGADCQTASDPGEAGRLAGQAAWEGRAYDLVLLNRRPEDPDGTRTASAVAAAAPGKNPLYALLGADLSEVDKEAARKAGIRTFLQAPLFPSAGETLLCGEGSGALEERAEEAFDFAGKRILLAEDNGMNREIAKKIIGETRAEVVEALDGKQAVEIFRFHEPGYFDVILMDLQMPVMDGYEATGVIRAMDRPDAATIPIYALTASTFDEDVRQVKEAGMTGHMGKPYTPEALYRTLAKAFRA